MNTRHLSFILVVAAFATGCSDSYRPYLIVAKPLPAQEPTPEPVPPMNVAGTWYSKSQVNAVNCGMGETVDAKVIVINQDEANIEMAMSSGDVFSGTVNGDIVEWAGSYNERGGTSNYTSASLVFSTDAGAGNAAWTWSNGTDSCNGTMAIDVSKEGGFADSYKNSSPDLADSIEFVDGIAYVNGSIGEDRDRDDFYKFTPVVDATVEIELSHFDTATTDLDLILFDADLNEVEMSVSVDSFEMIKAQVLAGQQYYVKVESLVIPGAQTYYLSLDIN
jgi:hypothetical protein